MRKNRKMDELRESRRLWPDPSDAPDVPPENVLRDYLANPGSAKQDIVGQIKGSVNCRRALEALLIRDGKHPWSELVPPKRAGRLPVHTRLVMPASGTLPVRETLVSPEAKTPAVGQIWTTKSQYEILFNYQISIRRTYLPPSVLIVSNGVNTGFDTVYRAVPVSCEALWPSARLADDEILLEVPSFGQMTAHLWLEYPISKAQLEGFRGALDEKARERLESSLCLFRKGEPIPSAIGGGRRLDDAEDADILLERERLHAIASALSSTAHARRRKALWDSEIQVLIGEINRIFQSQGLTIEKLVPLPMAAGTKASSSRCLMIRPGENPQDAMARASSPGRRRTGVASAKLVSEPILRDNMSVTCIWKISKYFGRIPPGAYFLVIDLERKRAIGRGVISGWYAAVISGEMRDFEAVAAKPEMFLLLVVPHD